MGQVTANISIYIPAAGETNYDAAFATGMINIDQHDHSGGPTGGVPIGTTGLDDFSVTFNKLNADVADTATGIGTETGPNANKLTTLGILKNLYLLAVSSGVGFLANNGHTIADRVFTNSASLDWTNGNGGGNPSALLAATSVVGTANQIAASVVAGVANLSLSPIVVNPTQPAFSASSVGAVTNVTGDGTAYQVLFASTIFDNGTNFAASAFTAPVNGVYRLNTNIQFGGLVENNSTQIYFYKNGSPIDYYALLNTYAIATSPGFTSSIAECTALLKLTATDIITVVVVATTASNTKNIGILGSKFFGTLES